MSTRLVGAASRFLDDKTSRRGFLRRAALVGSALVAAPATYLLRPLTAEAAILPSNCRTFNACNDGWTDFCVNITGVNTCPPGSLVGGWWRAEGNTYCGGKSRYYMDCHSSTCGCGCGSSGTCDHTCTGFPCHCNHDNCGERKVGCTKFRYGQCNNHHACIGPIICRVVTCVPPWEWDSSCSKTDAVAQVTYGHDAPGLHPDIRPKGPYPARPAVFNGSTWQLGNSLSSNGAGSIFTFGQSGDVAVVGDYSNSGVRTTGVVRNARHGVAGKLSLIWLLRQVEGPGEPDLEIEYGRPGDIPVVGDWNGNGVHTIGVVRGTRWMLKDSNQAGPPDYDFSFGSPGDIPVVGDWNGDGRTSVGLVRDGRWLLRASVTNGQLSHDFEFGTGAGQPVTGDWNGDGVTGVGWFNAGSWEIRNSLSSGSAEAAFQFGDPGGQPVTWGRVV